ncbi:hypothetical protein C8Q80DRAFT_946936 [Daedaleopsis nitida]|nr:hypothetical protein C8Q80DRAFT_946936 [Daedaleopsis nitida]
MPTILSAQSYPRPPPFDLARANSQLQQSTPSPLDMNRHTAVHPHRGIGCSAHGHPRRLGSSPARTHGSTGRESQSSILLEIQALQCKSPQHDLPPPAFSVHIINRFEANPLSDALHLSTAATPPVEFMAPGPGRASTHRGSTSLWQIPPGLRRRSPPSVFLCRRRTH